MKKSIITAQSGSVWEYIIRRPDCTLIITFFRTHKREYQRIVGYDYKSNKQIGMYFHLYQQHLNELI